MDMRELKLKIDSLEAELTRARQRFDDANDRILALEGKIVRIEKNLLADIYHFRQRIRALETKRIKTKTTLSA